MSGSEHNDVFDQTFQSNTAGGTLGGIATGMPIVIRVTFKPTPSILKKQPTQSFSGEKALFSLPEGSRHDPCVAIRAVPVVGAMVSLVLADAVLLNRSARL
jgi:chorismate synthase